MGTESEQPTKYTPTHTILSFLIILLLFLHFSFSYWSLFIFTFLFIIWWTNPPMIRLSFWKQKLGRHKLTNNLILTAMSAMYFLLLLLNFSFWFSFFISLPFFTSLFPSVSCYLLVFNLLFTFYYHNSSTTHDPLLFPHFFCMHFGEMTYKRTLSEKPQTQSHILFSSTIYIKFWFSQKQFSLQWTMFRKGTK